MESLLDNPMKAVLYLKELTTIVQNQQSLIQTQRQRIDELERKVEDLIGENRQLREPHPARPAPPPAAAAAPDAPQRQSPGASPPPSPSGEQQSVRSSGPHQHQTPPAPSSHHPQQLQLVPTSPPSPKGSKASPESAEESKRSPCCKSLVPQTPTTLCRSVGLARKADLFPFPVTSGVFSRRPLNQTVLHQFCCPAPEAPEETSACRKLPEDVSENKREAVGELDSSLGEEGKGGEGKLQSEVDLPPQPDQQEEEPQSESQPQSQRLHHTASPLRVQRNGAGSHSATSDYELSLDLKNKQIEMLELKYGGHLISRRAACKIQTAFRQYQLSKNFEKIRNSLLESRLPRRISLRKVRVQNTEGFSAERALAEGCNLAGVPLVRSPSLPVTVGSSLTDLEDSFTEQVQSLAKSIDDALSNWSLKTMCSLQEGGTYQFSTDSFSTAVEGGALGEPRLPQGSIDPSDLSRNASKLMMAFRDVTVQIDSQNIRVSSSVVESSTSVALSSCEHQEGASTATAAASSTANTTPASAPSVPSVQPPPPAALSEPNIDDEEDVEFPAPPPSEEDLGEEELASLTLEDNMAAAQAQQEAVSETADNSSEQMSSSSTSTEARSTSEASSKEALQAMILSLPRYHCENPASCKSPTLSTDVMRKRLYRIGLNLFNINPDKGLQFLISRGFIPDTPIGVAHFLLQRKGLSRQMIGEFLGNSKKPFNRDVLDCVVDEMDFSGMELDEALRKFQAHIRVQGEAQKVERLIEAFSQRYCMCNPDVVQQFHNPDTIFILAFAIILLNTDMYSPNIKPDRKMLLEDFIRNLRGVDDGADIPRDMVVGIYERIQLRELRSNEDHVTYVSKVEQSIVGMKSVLSVPHRRLVCCSRLFEVTDVNKAQKQAAHQREVFLFNDLIVILKLCPKKKSSAAYTFCKAMGLLGMQFHLFENEYYPHGITIVSPFGSDKKQVFNFCAQSAEELLKFVEDLKESIAEVSEMEQIRIEWELEKQQGTKAPSLKTNGAQLELRARQGSPAGSLSVVISTQFESDIGRLVSIHNRLQTYQLSSTAPSPESAALPNHQGEPLLQQAPSPQHPQPQSASSTPAHQLHFQQQHPQPAVSMADLRPETLIQCQQIVKVIMLDSGGLGRMEAFLGHMLSRSAVSTPVRSPDGSQGNDGHQPPLPPPPPPYNHPHQYIPPDPRLTLHRTPSGSRSMV
uniref:IQ motif and SEC7 domain-containing protein 3 n=1 Tax=Tetraodon nigroviridis TaxID=99883 RepID=H3D0D2_TETNG